MMRCSLDHPHTVSADVTVHPAGEFASPFCALHLRADSGEICLILPAGSYHRARDVADAWNKLREPVTRIATSEGVIPA